MIRSYRSFPITDFTSIKQQMLNYLKQFSIFCFLDNHQYNLPGHSAECLCGAGFVERMHSADQHLDAAEKFIESQNDWIFGHLSYDLSEDLFHTANSFPLTVKFPGLFFFVPEIVFRLDTRQITIGSFSEDHESILRDIYKCSPLDIHHRPVGISQRMGRKEYVDTIEALRQHIIRGDCYEINYCMEFFAENADIDPFTVFHQLGVVSPNPFSGLYRYYDQFLMCASPERYLRKQAQKIISQPIKGTAPRNINDISEDNKNRNILRYSAKDRSENVMVVDLVRNDFAKVCTEGSVKVDELFGVYSFPQVHQMISTISGELNSGTKITDIFKASFPMGSMTGAPKKRVIELIAAYEKSRRGLFSGAIGYISPEKDADFNVVIRSILYNAADAYLSLPAGSGITFYSDPELEYTECLLKAEAMLKALAPA